MQASVVSGHDPVQHGPAPALDQAEGRFPGRQRAQRRGQRPGGQRRQRGLDQTDRGAELLDAHQRAGVDIAGGVDRRRQRQVAVGRKGVVAAHVGVDARRPRHVAQHAVIARDLVGQAAGAVQAVQQHGVAQADGHHLLEVGQHGVQFGGQVQARRQVMADAARDDAAAQQAVAGELFVQAQQPLAQAKALRMGKGETGVVADGAEVGHVVVEALHLQQHQAQGTGARRNLTAGQRLQRLAVGQRVADGGVAGDALGQLDALGGQPALEQLLRALVREVEANLEVNHRLAHHAEAEVPRLDDARVHRPHRNLVDALAAHRQEGKARAVVLEIARRQGILAQGIVGLRPEAVAHQRSRVGLPQRLDAEEVLDLALEARGRIVERSHGGDGRIVGGQLLDGVQEPVVGVVGEQVDDLEAAQVGAAVVGDHQRQLGLELAAQELRQLRRGAARQPAVQFVAAAHLHILAAVGQRGQQGSLEH